MALFPDLVLFTQERGRRLQGTVEVETGESINTLEALSQWLPFARLRVPFFLYVPSSAIDTVRRLCSEHGIAVTEIWTYHTAMDQIRFTMVHRAPESAASAAKSKAAAADLDEDAAVSERQPEAAATAVLPAPKARAAKRALEPKPTDKRSARVAPAPATRAEARPRIAVRSAAPARKAATSKGAPAKSVPAKTAKAVKRR